MDTADLKMGGSGEMEKRGNGWRKNRGRWIFVVPCGLFPFSPFRHPKR